MLFEESITFPLKMEQLQKVLELKKELQQSGPVPLNIPVMAVVSTTRSALKGAHFINFVSNLRLSITLDEEDELSKDERFELLKCYLNSRMLSEIKTLNEVSTLILLERKGIVHEGDVFLTQEERAEFSQLHDELLVKYEIFIESILIGLPFSIKEYASTIGKDLIDQKVIKVITDPGYIGSNVVSMLIEPNFLEFYLSLNLKHTPAFFDSQWFEPVFNGYSLLSIMTVNSSLFPFMQSLYEQWFTEEEIKSAS